MPKEYPPEFFENKQEQARISLAILREMPTDVFYHNVIIALADLLQRMVHDSLREEVFTKSHKSQLTQRAADVGTEWVCSKCSTTNMLDVPICQACSHPRG